MIVVFAGAIREQMFNNYNLLKRNDHQMVKKLLNLEGKGTCRDIKIAYEKRPDDVLNGGSQLVNFIAGSQGKQP